MPRNDVGDSRREIDSRAATVSALMNNLGLHDPTPHRDWRDLYGTSLASVASASAMARGERRPDPAVAVALEMQAWRDLGTNDFSGILENIAQKLLLKGHEAAPVVHPYLARLGPVPTFMRTGRVALEQFDVPRVGENGEVARADISDRRTYVQAETYAAIISISREVLLGDDPGAFGRAAEFAGRACALRKEYTFLDALTSASGAGPTMQEDSVALFHTATHGNYVSSGGTAPTVAAVNVATAAMRTRKDPGTNLAQNIPPRYLVVPAALEATARVIAASWSTTLGDADGDLKVLVSGYLDSKSATRWYLLSDAEKFDVWEMATLGGTAEPFIESKRSFDTDAMELRVMQNFGFTALDWRTQFANAGA